MPLNTPASPIFREEHEMLRDQLRRFIEEEFKPRADKWEDDSFVPRDVLRRMGELDSSASAIPNSTAAGRWIRWAAWCWPKRSATRQRFHGGMDNIRETAKSPSACTAELVLGCALPLRTYPPGTDLT